MLRRAPKGEGRAIYTTNVAAAPHKAFTIPFVATTPTDEKLTFGRASAALVLAF